MLFGGWLVTGVVLFSAMPRLHLRYLEVLAPAVAAVLGLGAAGPARGARGRPGAVALVVAALAPGAVTAAQVAGSQATDGGTPGARPAAEVGRLSAFLRTHRSGRYEAAEATPDVAAPLIARDGRPVLLLSTGLRGHALVSPAGLRRAVAAGQVRYAYLGSSSRAAPPRARPPPAGRTGWAATSPAPPGSRGAAGSSTSGRAAHDHRDPRPARPGRAAPAPGAARRAGRGRARHGQRRRAVVRVRGRGGGAAIRALAPVAGGVPRLAGRPPARRAHRHAAGSGGARHAVHGGPGGRSGWPGWAPGRSAATSRRRGRSVRWPGRTWPSCSARRSRSPTSSTTSSTGACPRCTG